MNNNDKYIIRVVSRKEIPNYYNELSSTKVVLISLEYFSYNGININFLDKIFKNTDKNWYKFHARYNTFIAEKTSNNELNIYTDLYWFVHEYHDELYNIYCKIKDTEFCKLSKSMFLEPARLFFWCNFIYNRQYIWYQRYVNKTSQNDWYIDETLKYTKILNIFRCHDKVSSYIINKICKPNYDIRTKIFNLIAARYINTFNFYDIFGGKLFDINKMSNPEYQEWIYNCIANHRVTTGKYIFNNCYCVCRGKRPNQGTRVYTKAWTFVDSLILASELVSSIELDKFCDDYKYAESIYYRCRYVGPFLVGEMMQDAAYLDETHWTSDDFLYIGPGAVWQASLMDTDNAYDILVDRATQVIKTIYENQGQIFNEFTKITGKDFYSLVTKDCLPIYPKICISDIESSFCELRKYTKVFSNKSAESLNQKIYQITNEPERL